MSIADAIKRRESNKQSNNGTFDARLYVKEKYRKKKADEFGLDTFESDLNSLGKTVTKIRDEWQTEETMVNTRSSIESMQKRIGAYQEYRNQYGGEDLADLSDISKSYESILGEWDKISSDYGLYKSADEYNTAKKEYEGKTKANLKDVQKEIDSLSTTLEQAEEIQGRLRNANRSNAMAKGRAKGVGLDLVDTSGIENELNTFLKENGYGSVQELRDAVDGKKFYLEDAQRIQDEIKLNNEETERSKSKEGKQGYELFLKDEEAAKEVENNKTWGERVSESMALAGDSSIAGSELITVTNLKRKYKDENAKPTDDWTEAEKYTFGSYYLEDPEKAYDYGARINNAKGKAKQDEKTSEIVDSATSDFWSGAGHTLGAILTAPTALIDATNDMTDVAAGRRIVETGDVSPFEYSQAVTSGVSEHLNNLSGTLDEDVPIIGGKGLGDLYGLGTSVAQSAVSAYTLGSVGTLVSYFGQGVASGVDDALSRGATDEQALLYGTILGVAEGVSEKIGIDNLFKIGSSRTLKEFFMNVLRQGGAEGLEEGFSSVVGNIADNFVMQDKSNFNSLVKDYMASGLSSSEAKKKAWTSTIGDIAYDVLGGFVSGVAHAMPQTGVQTLKGNKQAKATGQTIRANERVGEIVELAGMTPEGSDTHNLYTQYAKKGMTAENVTDKQLGYLYKATRDDAVATMQSKKASEEEVTSAVETFGKLNKIDTDNVVKKNRDKLNVGEETKVTESGASVDVKGIKLGATPTLITSEGEVSADEVTLSDRDADLVARAQLMPEEVANLYLSQADGQTDIEAYTNSFNLVSAYAEHNFDQNTILERKGVLSTDQVKAIYNATVKAQFDAKQKKLDEISAKQGKTMFVQGTLNDSIIDYNSKTTDGSKVNWNSLTSRQRAAIKFVKMFTKATGVNVTFIKSEVVDGKHKGENGSYNPETNTIEIDVYAGRIDAGTVKDTIIPTLSHEMTHWMKAKAISSYENIRNDILKTLSEKSGISSEALISQEMNRLKKAHKDMDVTPEKAIDEIVARACADMLSDSKKARELLNKMSANEQQGFIEKVKETFENLMNWIEKLIAEYKNEDTSGEAKLLREYKEDLQRIQTQWDNMLIEAVKMNQALQNEGVKGEQVIGELAKANELQFNERLVETHFDKIRQNYSEDAAIDVDTLLGRYEKIVDIWKRLGGELNSKFLEDWNNKEGKDRAFSVFKAQAGYKYNVELSSMCKKGIPLFEAIDKIVKQEVMKELNTKTLGKAEKEILYDILKEKNFEIPCAICYVEQARQREGVIIDAFLNGKIEKTKTGKITQYKLGWNETLAEVQKEMKAAGCDYTFPALDRSVATDNYRPQDISMDEETQEYFFEALKKVANNEIRRYNKEAKNKKKLITKTDPASLKAVFKGKLPLNIAMFKTMFEDSSSRFTIADDLLYSSMTTQNLAASHYGLYSIFNSQGGVGGYKTKQGTIVYWGDILKKTWKPDTLRKEGGVRNQSNSDFLMFTLLDHAQMYIDFTAKGYYLQAYTKVLAELKLFGLSKGKINASLIPKVHEYRNADGSVDIEKTRLNAGLDENGNLIFDDFEGINHTEAFMLLEDAEYSKSIGGVCIGYSDNHIQKLLDDNRIQLIIGFHDKTNDPDKRYRGAKYSKNYNGLNEATYYDKEGNLKTKHIGFNQFVIKAEGKFKNGKESYTHNGKTYKYNDIPKLATDLYLEHCESKGLFPAYSQGGIDFSKHENYYKLLADFSLYDINGNYVPHQKVEFNMPDQVPFLDKNGNKAYEKTEDYIKRELGKELKVRDSISEKLADTSEDGIIPEFKKRVNELHSEKQYEDRDITEGMSEEERYNVLKDKKIQPQTIEIDENFDIDFEYLESNIKSIVEKPLLKKLRELGYLKHYKTSVIDVDFELTGKGVSKSLHSQTVDYGGSFGDFAKVILNLQKLLDNSVLLEIHSDKGKGTPKENPQLRRTYVLMSVFQEGKYLKPVQFEVKQYVDENNRLYLAVALTKIETSVMGNSILDENQASTYLLPVSNISIPDLFAKINPIDMNILKYIPNQFLNAEQIKAKNIALEKEKEKYSKGNSDIQYEDRDIVAYGTTAKLRESTVDLYLKDYAAKSSPNYAQAYITYMTPYDYLEMTTSNRTSKAKIENESTKFDRERFERAVHFQPINLVIDSETGEVITHEGRHRMVALSNEGIYDVPVLLFDYKNKESKQTLENFKLTGQFNEFHKATIKRAIPLSYANRDIIIEEFSKLNSQQKMQERYGIRQTLQYSDRETESVYDKMGEADRIAEENKKLKADVERLIGVIGDEKVDLRRFRSLADFLKKRTGNDVNREELGDMLKEAYTFIQSGENVEWQDVMVKANEIATFLMNRDLKVPVNYFKEVMSNVRKDTFALSAEQRAKAEEMFGGYSNFHKAMFGRVNITTKEGGMSLEERWNNWSQMDAALRIKNDVGEIVGVDKTFYDKRIISACSNDWQPAMRVVGRVLFDVGFCVGDGFLHRRVVELARAGAILVRRNENVQTKPCITSSLPSFVVGGVDLSSPRLFEVKCL